MEISVFIREYAPLAGEAGRAFRIDPVVILAQAAIETGWGESTLCRERDIGSHYSRRLLSAAS